MPGVRYFFTVLRSSPRLVAISFCERPASQCTKISVTFGTSKVLLAIKAPVAWADREQPSIYEDSTNRDTRVVPVRNYVSTPLGNYVSDKRLNPGIA
jgi:hypothetical protein